MKAQQKRNASGETSRHSAGKHTYSYSYVLYSSVLYTSACLPACLKSTVQYSTVFVSYVTLTIVPYSTVLLQVQYSVKACGGSRYGSSDGASGIRREPTGVSPAPSQSTKASSIDGHTYEPVVLGTVRYEHRLIARFSEHFQRQLRASLWCRCFEYRIISLRIIDILYEYCTVHTSTYLVKPSIC